MIAGLNRSFEDLKQFQSERYRLLPMRFLSLDAKRYIATNLGGNHQVLTRKELQDLVGHQLAPNTILYDNLKANHFLADDDSSVHQELLAIKYRSRQSRLPDFTSLHLFVITLRCDHSCHYCQVSRVSENRSAYDMTNETANRAIDLMFKSPSPYLKVEFQGGEPLLNFPLIEYVVAEVNRRNDGRSVKFVITSNLSFLTEQMLSFCAAHDVTFSTSLDGPENLHNANRPRPGSDSHARTIAGIKRIRDRLGENAVSALMTSTAESLKQPEAIIDEYVKQGFNSIFLRFISPYGFAAKTSRIGYETEEFIEFFKRGLGYIIDLNRSGVPMREVYSTLLLRRILTPYATGYVDLQSPSGIGISVLVYNYNGDVYGSDEGRMLAEMGDTTFRLGTVENTIEQLFLDSELLPMVFDTMLEGLAGCSDCALLPFCGSDPVFHHRTQGDIVGHRPTSGFCKRNMEIMRHLIRLLEDEPDSAGILRTWI